MSGLALQGPRSEIGKNAPLYPELLSKIPRPPEMLYVIGDAAALESGLAVIGARKSTPYGRSCAHHFARMAAEKGIPIISGGARGCDAEAHRAALEAGGTTIVFLGGGCDCVYPAENRGLFQRIIDAGGAIVSEHPWDCQPRPYMFRERNRLIAGLALSVLIVEAGLPSGTFSTADEALEAGREVWVVPGAITSATSLGSNRLILQGALPIIDDEAFEDALLRSFGALKWSHDQEGEAANQAGAEADGPDGDIIEAIRAQPLTMDELYTIARACYGDEDFRPKLSVLLIEAEACGLIARQPDGRWTGRLS